MTKKKKIKLAELMIKLKALESEAEQIVDEILELINKEIN